MKQSLSQLPSVIPLKRLSKAFESSTLFQRAVLGCFLQIFAIGCVTFEDGEQLKNEVFQLQTRILELEGQIDEGGKANQVREVSNSQQIATASARLEGYDEQLRRIHGEIDRLAQGVRTGEMPGLAPDHDSIARILNRLRERIAAVEQTQTLVLQKLDAKTKKQQRVPAKNVAQLKTAFTGKRYAHVVADGPLIIEKAKGQRKGEARYFYAESLFKLGKLSDAALAFNGLLTDKSIEHRLPMIKMRLGDTFRLLGDKDVAAIYYTELVEQFPESPSAVSAQKKLHKPTSSENE